MFNSHSSDPRMRPISSMETLLSVYTSLSLHCNGRRSHLVYGNLILSPAHLWGKAQTIYPFIQLVSVAEQIAGKTTEPTVDHRSHSHDSKKVTVTLPAALRESLVELVDCAKGHYKSLRPTGSANTHWNMSEYEPNTVHSVSSWMWSANEKWLRGCCSGIWQVSRNSLLIKPVPPGANRSCDSVLQNVWAQCCKNRQRARRGKTWLVYIRNCFLLSRKVITEELLVGM